MGELINTLNKFSNDVFLYITGENKPDNCLLVKKHDDNLKTHGDFSFPNNVKPWLAYLHNRKSNDEKCILEYIGMDKDGSGLVEASIKWVIPVNKVIEEKDRIEMFLDRTIAIKIGFSEAARNNTILSKKMEVSENPRVITNDDGSGVTSLRVVCVANAVRELFKIHSQDNFPNRENTRILVTSKTPVKSSETKELCSFLCGPVINVKTSTKETTIDAEEFVKIRASEMSLIAQHKYGVRMPKNKLDIFAKKLGTAAAKFELLQTKPGSPVKINFNYSTAGSSKGAAFVLYNCARLQTLIQSFNDKVTSGVYPPLPEYNKIDFSLLTQEEEWIIIFNYILGFPCMLQSCVELNEKRCDFKPHMVCNFLSSMVKVFSQYYRRSRILTEARSHLLPVLYARIHMIKVLNDILTTCLSILHIESVPEM